MANQPNYELLKDAYAIIDGIPEEAFDLDSVVRKKGKRLDCGTIACAAGWIGLHPTFAAHLKPKIVKDKWSGTSYFHWLINDERTYYFNDAMAHLFGIPRSDALNLFERRGSSELDSPSLLRSNQTDKQLWLARVRVYLKQKGQLA